MRKSIITVLLMFLSLATFGQYSQKPTWADGYHKDLRNSYLDVFSARGTSVEEARQNAIKQIVDERSRATGRRYSIRENNGSITLSGQDELTVKCRVVDEYQRHSYGSYEVFLLVQTARHPDYAYETVNVTDGYSVGGRFLIPGWAQIYKGQTAKGVIMLAGTVGCGIGALVCELTRQDYKNKMKEQPQFAKDYNTKANNYEAACYVCLGGAAAFYLWNIIDGLASKGKRRVIVKNSYSSLSLNPVITPKGGGVSLALNF